MIIQDYEPENTMHLAPICSSGMQNYMGAPMTELHIDTVLVLTYRETSYAFGTLRSSKDPSMCP